MKMNKIRPRKRKYIWDYSTDCAICQAMKEGKTSTEKELKEAFRKAEENGKRKAR